MSSENKKNDCNHFQKSFLLKSTVLKMCNYKSLQVKSLHMVLQQCFSEWIPLILWAVSWCGCVLSRLIGCSCLPKDWVWCGMNIWWRVAMVLSAAAVGGYELGSNKQFPHQGKAILYCGRICNVCVYLSHVFSVTSCRLLRQLQHPPLYFKILLCWVSVCFPL